MPYILPNGNYYDAGPHVTAGSVEVAVRPLGFVLTVSWLDDPLNPLIAWRAKNAGEIDTEKTIAADFEVQFDELLKAFALVVMDKLNILRAQHALADRIPAQIKTAIKAKL